MKISSLRCHPHSRPANLALASDGMNSTEPVPLPDERVLEMTGIKLAELTGKEWQVQPGPLLKGPGSVGVRVGPRHSDSYRHIDLEFLLNPVRGCPPLATAAGSALPRPLRVGRVGRRTRFSRRDLRPVAKLP